MKMILASNNAHKFSEFSAMVAPLGIELVFQRDAGCDFEVEETGSSFEENAYLKAEAVVKATGFPAIADDSGLCVDALDGAPGIYSARYGFGHEAADSKKYTYLLSQLEGVTDRSARFVSCICCLFPNGDVIRSRGELEGEILTSPRGDNGFGYDPVFLAIGSEKSNAELTMEEKNSISHRGKALRSFVKQLEEYQNVHNK